MRSWLFVVGLLMFGQTAVAEDEPSPKPKEGEGEAAKDDGKSKKKKKKKKKSDEHDHDHEGEGVGTNLLANAKSAQFGLEYAASLRGSDNGLEATGVPEAEEPPRTHEIALRKLKITFSGELATNAEFAVGLEPAVDDGHTVYANATWWITKSMGLLGGVDYVAQGGFENMHEGYETVILSPYSEALLPLTPSEAMLALKLKLLGEMKLQLVQDKLSEPVLVGDGETSGDSRTKQPAVVLEWAGEFGMIKPLLQFGSYDLGRSKYFGLGVGVEMKSILLYFDFIKDQRVNSYVAAGSEPKKLVTDYTTIAFEAHMLFGKASEAFLFVSSFDAVEPEDTKLGLEDRKFNAASAEGLVLDDNAFNFGVGTRYGAVEKMFRPFFAITSRSGNFQDPKDPKAVAQRRDVGYEFGISGAM